jgi:phytoene/squalene synthetase
MKNVAENMDYCRRMVAESDRERYMLGLFAPAAHQRALWAVLAFNQEVAKIWDSVSEAALAEIKLQWWSEVLDEILEGTVREQPVIQELATIEGRKQIFPLLKQAIEARRIELFTGGTDITSLKKYAAGAGGAFHQAIFVTIRPEAKDAALQVADCLGKAWATLGLVRALPYYWQHSKDMGSEGLAAITQLPDQDRALERLQPIIDAMAEFAAEEIHSAKTAAKAIARRERDCLLPVALLDLHLKQLRKTNNNPFELPRYEVSDFKKMRALLWASIKK